MTVTIYRGEQRTPEWYALRAGKPTSSKFEAIMAQGRSKGDEAVTRRNYRIRLATEILTGEPLPDDKPKSSAMEDGNEREPLARLAYERFTDALIEDDVAFIWNEHIQAGASTDGLLGEDGMIEAKCPTRPVHIEYLLADRCPPKYKWQVQGELLVAQRKWCDFVTFNPEMPEALRLHIARIEPDPVAQEQLVVGIQEFNRDLQRTVDQLREVIARRTTRV
jgi:hypothetical protein